MQLVSSQSITFTAIKTLPQACLRSKRHNLLHPLQEETILGRCSSNTVQVVDRLASRKHAIIMMTNDSYYVIDLGSLNGTFVNGERIESRVELKTGDKITIGLEVFVFAYRS